MGILSDIANYLDRQKRDLSGWVHDPSAQLERNVANWVVPREGVIRKGGLSQEKVDQESSAFNPGNFVGAGVIKPAGGNWLSGSVEGALSRLKSPENGSALNGWIDNY